MKIRKVVIPVAGLGTRFLPITKSIAKEMLPIVDKPCIQYLVEEAIKSGIEEIIFVTSKDKPEIQNYFSPNEKLAEKLRASNKLKELKIIEELEKMAKFSFVFQDEPKGDGHAILCAKELIQDEPFAVLFGDDIYDADPPALAQLIKVYEEKNAPVIALEEINKKDSYKYGIIDPETQENETYSIKGLIEKPSPEIAPSNLAITGKYIVTPELLKTLETTQNKSNDGELRLIDGMRQYIKTFPIYGQHIKGQRFDTGDKNGYLNAVIHFSKKDKKQV